MPSLDTALRFEPTFVPRVWGGRRLAELYGKPLPAGERIGESWEVSDREDVQSLVDGGVELQELWLRRRREVFGRRGADHPSERFPLLVKLLDAREALSIQVHPPAARAAALGGEPKSEVWFFLEAEPGAHVFAGVKPGLTRERFADALSAGEDITALLHRIDVRAGTALYLPSGRVHAIGPGCVIAEVQQSSDTTYRVYDYGRPHELHVEQSLACIDFDDHEPPLLEGEAAARVTTPYFDVARRSIAAGEEIAAAPAGEAAIVAVVSGQVGRFGAGDFFLAPAAHELRLRAEGGAEILQIMLPDAAAASGA